jgi:hypothetical protein
MKSDETVRQEVARLASLRADTDPILEDLGATLAHQATRLASPTGPTAAVQLLETCQTRAEIEAGRAGKTVTEGRLTHDKKDDPVMIKIASPLWKTRGCVTTVLSIAALLTTFDTQAASPTFFPLPCMAASHELLAGSLILPLTIW